MILCKKVRLAVSTYILIIFMSACSHAVSTVDNEYHYKPPLYNHASLFAQPDTLDFSLGENVYNQIRSFNHFQNKGIDYISFYERRSESINVYYLMDQRLCKSISLKKFFKKQRLHKTSVFIKNWDSILVINKSTISLFDSSGNLKQKIDFPDEPDNNAAVFDSNKQPILIGNKLFVISANTVDDKSINALRDWKVMYQFDIEKGETQLLYPLPRLYQEDLYGYYFLKYNFCYNNRGKFVFSFAADTLLYETDLVNYNRSYFARSREHKERITPVSKEELNEKNGLKSYATRNSYSSVFFDPQKKYYLREVKHKLSPEEFDVNKRQRRTVLIFNEQFQIIGESVWPEGVDFDSLFFTPDGHLYARTYARDENALHFVRFAYEMNMDKGEQLTRK